MIDSGAKQGKSSVVRMGGKRPNINEKQVELKDSEIEYRWRVAVEFYPELNSLRDQLANFPDDISYNFVKLLVRRRKFQNGEKVATELVLEYLDNLCDSNSELVEYGFDLYTCGSHEELRCFVELCSVFGGDVSKVKIEEFIGRRCIRVFSPEVRPFQAVVETAVPEVNQMHLAGAVEEHAGEDVLSVLKRSMLGRIYINHVKARPRLRMLSLAVWKRLCPVYIAWTQHLPHLTFAKTAPEYDWYQIEKLSAHVERNRIVTHELIGSSEMRIQRPNVFPKEKAGEVSLVSRDTVFPSVYVARVERAVVVGGSNLVQAEDTVICHDLYDFSRDYTSEELHGRNRISFNKKKISLMSKDNESGHMAVAATFVDAIAVNYAHWLTEVLPRVLAFCTDEKYADIPVIVDEGLHKNIMESLFLAVGSTRKVVVLPTGKRVSIDELYVPSVTGYVPFEPRGKRKPGDSDGFFSALALTRLRDFMKGLGDGVSGISWPDKIYLRRMSGARNITNADEVERMMVEQGFTVVDCATLTFLQQTCLFANADIIVGASGAAFANAVFSKPGTQACIIISSHVDMVYGYWCNVLSAVGVSVNYLLGDIGENQDFGVHSDFSVDMQSLEKMLKELDQQ